MKQRLFVAIFSGFMLLSVTLVQAGSFFKIGEAAPDFTLTSLDGQSVTLSQFKGKVVVLGLFHICEPCLIQGTNLQKVYEATRGKSVAVVGVNSSGDSSADVTEFLHSFPVKVTYPYLVDPKQITDKAYGGGKFIPNVYVIDQNGMIRWQRVGNFFTDGTLAGHEVILQEVEKLLSHNTQPASM
ncbi:MAG: redoxin domain-containing protein [Nitrospira sp.]|nr:redoxin domain-containing protein [Nitrospira sp.]MCB9711109.1 redoxin domain-containing protein [Nitrospiraceae bacterium]MDR4488985.1 TlpA family protein disulfide reductase [Nitrospirales bacterium]MCA9464040.1 redoxin domain-containing protein [Nitrospira sp.]MCA9475667.1 redoxin domain-containing protein [Nitrospira sp.]